MLTLSYFKPKRLKNHTAYIPPGGAYTPSPGSLDNPGSEVGELGSISDFQLSQEPGICR